LLSVPVPIGEIDAVNVNVAEPFTARFTLVLIEPVPLAAHELPAVAAHVHVAPLKTAGSVSTTVAPVAAAGPAFDTTIVYVTEPPGTDAPVPSVLVIDRSVETVSVSVSVVELFDGVGSVVPTGAVMVAVLLSEPVADGEIVAVRV
jgi:hypothetical protein